MGTDRYDQLVGEFLRKKRIAIWGMEDAKSDPGQMLDHFQPLICAQLR